MKPSIAAKLAQLSARLAELNRLLSAESATADVDAFRKLSREHSEIGPVVEPSRIACSRPYKWRPAPIALRSVPGRGKKC